MFLGTAGSCGPGTLTLWRETAAQGGPATCPGSWRPGGVWTLLCPGGWEPAPLISLPRLREALCVQLTPSQALPVVPGTGDPTDVHRRAHSLPSPACQAYAQLSGHLPPELHLGPCPQRRGRQRPSVGGTWNLLGQPCCWKAQSTCPGLGHGCAGGVHKGSTGASASPGSLGHLPLTVAEPQQPAPRAQAPPWVGRPHGVHPRGHHGSLGDFEALAVPLGQDPRAPGWLEWKVGW